MNFSVYKNFLFVITVMTILSVALVMSDYLYNNVFMTRLGKYSVFTIMLTSIVCISVTIITLLKYSDDKNIKDTMHVNITEIKEKTSPLSEAQQEGLMLEPDLSTQAMTMSTGNDEILIDTQDLHTAFLKSEERLVNELKNIGKRANTNLIIGSIITIVGWGLLLWFVIDVSQQKLSGWLLLNAFIPRISIVILIEMFSYFFLNLYKDSIDRIKYYQNELTNIESRKIAILACIAIDKDNVHKASVIERLLQVERNIVQKKNETTIDIEKMKVDNSTFKQIVSTINDIVQTVNGKK